MRAVRTVEGCDRASGLPQEDDLGTKLVYISINGSQGEFFWGANQREVRFVENTDLPPGRKGDTVMFSGKVRAASCYLPVPGDSWHEHAPRVRHNRRLFAFMTATPRRSLPRTSPDRISLFPGAGASLPGQRLRILCQDMLRDILDGRYRTVVCGVNDHDNSHGIIAQLYELVATSQWSAERDELRQTVPGERERARGPRPRALRAEVRP